MQKQLILHNHERLAYTLRTSKRARRMRLSAHSDGSVVVTTPHHGYYNETLAERFIREKTGWLLGKLAIFKQFQGTDPLARLGIPAGTGKRDYTKNKPAALALVQQKTAHFAAIYGARYNKVSVRNQKTCWGSCSRKNNLNFNYRIIYLPEAVQDYIVVHEICHLKEFNHSKTFWALVAKTVPNYAEVRRQLRRNRLITR